jgi:hypothetical protein
MKLPFSLLIAVLVSACSSPEQLKTKPPIYSGSSTKDVSSLAGCISDALEGQRMRNIQARPTANGYVVSRVDQTLYGPDTAFLIELQRTGNRASIVALSALPLEAGNRMIVSAIRSCE